MPSKSDQPESTQVVQTELEGQHLRRGRRLADGYGAAIERGQDVQVLLHSPMGIRVDCNLSQSALELWISPQAKQSTDAFLRNFSNRDDQTRIFDRISFPGLDAAAYRSCDYDPFHAVMHYDGLSLHVVPLVDAPAVLLWAEGEELVVDLKSDKQDAVTRQEPRCFAVSHPDRGLELEFAAAAGPEAAFQHQRHLDAGRSAYARLTLPAGQPLLIGGELAREAPAEALAKLADLKIDAVVEDNEQRVREGVAPVAVAFYDEAWQRQYDLNQRVLFSCQDHGGWMPAALRALYYLCWHFDGSISACALGQHGWAEFLHRWTRFELANPTETETPIPGRYFGQLVTRRISKQEEWGLYNAVWSAFTYFTQTGSLEFVQPPYRTNLFEALRWLEEYTWDAEQTAFCTYYRGEDPFEGSHDFGYDEAVGKPMSQNAPSFEGLAIRRQYSFSANMLMYNVYTMLAAMLDGPEADALAEKAARLEPFLRRCRDEHVSRYVRLEDGSLRADHDPEKRWPVGCYFAPEMSWRPDILLHDAAGHMAQVRAGRERFVHHLLQNVLARDPALMDPELELFLEVFLPQCARAGRYLQMAGTVIENVNCADGSYHDNRPQIFSTALMNACLIAQGVRRQPFGLAVRANRHVRHVDRFAWQGRELSISFQGDRDAASVEAVKIGDRVARRCLQLPERWLDAASAVTVEQSDAKSAGPRWMGSTVRLLDVEEGDREIRYALEAFGNNQIFFDAEPARIRLSCEGQNVEVDRTTAHGWHYLRFAGGGRFELTVSS